MFDFVVRAFTHTHYGYRAAATGAQVLFANSHRFDVPFLRRDIVDDDRFALSAHHRHGITRFERISLGFGIYTLQVQHVLSPFHLFRCL